MRENFEKIPPPLQKQIIMRCGAALVSLLLMVVSLLLEGNLYLSLSVLLFFTFYGFSALQLLYRAVTDQIVVIRNVDEGDIITVYTATGTPVYENEGCQQLSTYLAIDILKGRGSK